MTMCDDARQKIRAAQSVEDVKVVSQNASIPMTDITTRLLDMSEAMWMDRDHDELDALLLEAKGEIERLDAERDAAIGKRRVWVEWCTRVLRHHRKMIKAAEARADNAEKRCAELEAALKPFADEAGCYDPDDGDSDDICWATPAYFKIRDLRRARAALTPQQKGNADGKQ